VRTMPVPAVTAKGRTWLGAGVVALVLGAGATPAAALTHIGATKPSGATFQVHMTVNGAVRGSLVFKVIELDTPCTGGTGPGSAGEDGVPSPDGEKVKFDGVLLEYAINNPSYKGPGKYGTADFANGSAAISVDKASPPPAITPRKRWCGKAAGPARSFSRTGRTAPPTGASMGTSAGPARTKRQPEPHWARRSCCGRNRLAANAGATANRLAAMRIPTTIAASSPAGTIGTGTVPRWLAKAPTPPVRAPSRAVCRRRRRRGLLPWPAR
jgi:hypothetical protein